MSPRYSQLLIAAFGFWYLVLIFVIPRDTVINGLLDDSFYYLQTARNIAAGLGSSFDGVELTNGYHPLWMILLLIPARALSANPDLLVQAALLLGAVFGIGSLLWIRGTLARTAGAWAAAVGLMLFAWPRFFGQTLNLLETSLLLFLYTTIARALVHRPSGRLVTGLLLGLASLARLDTVFLLAAFGILGTIEALRERGEAPLIRALWARLSPLLPASLVVLPYLAWNLIRFGHLQPVSGAAKSGFPIPELRIEALSRHPEFALLLFVGIGFLLASLRRRSSPVIRMLGLFGLAGLLHMAYTLLFMRWGVDRWHFVLLMPTALIGLPWLAERVIGRTAWVGGMLFRRAALAIGLIAVVVVQGSSMTARQGRHLAAVREAAIWARDSLPEDAVFAMSDAGVFAYYSGRTTINLDGLINSYGYLEALREGRVNEYLRRRGVGYIFDQSAYGVPEWLDGDYDERILRLWYRPRSRVGAEIRVRREDEVYRRNLLSRSAALSPPERNALILYRYRPPAPQSGPGDGHGG